MSAHEYDADETIVRVAGTGVLQASGLPQPEARVSTRALLYVLAAIQIASAIASLIGVTL